MDKINKIRLLAGLTIDPKHMIAEDRKDDIEIPVNIAKSAVPAAIVASPDIVDAASTTGEGPIEVDGDEKEMETGGDENTDEMPTDEVGDDDAECCSFEVGQNVTHNGEPMVVAIASEDGEYVGVAPVGSEGDVSSIVLVNKNELEAGEESAEANADDEDEIAAAEADVAALDAEEGGDDVEGAIDAEADADISAETDDDVAKKLGDKIEELHGQMEAAGNGKYRIPGFATTGATLRQLSMQKAKIVEQLAAVKKKIDEKVDQYYDTKDQDKDEEALDTPVNVSDGKANSNTVWKAVTMKNDKKEAPNQLDHLGAASDGEQVKKVNVPASVKTALKDAIKDTEEQFARLGATDIDSRFFYKSLATAFATLLQHIEAGTVEEIKKGQIFMQTLMSPMMHKIPAVVSNFLAKGGEQRSLKDYMTPVDAKYPITGPRNYLK